MGPDCSDGINLSHRFNTDTVINGYGRKLIDLCKNNNMQILNGRSQGDTPGRFTFNDAQCSSTVDYAFASKDILDYIAYFQVNKPNIWSGDSDIEAVLQTDFKPLVATWAPED